MTGSLADPISKLGWASQYLQKFRMEVAAFTEAHLQRVTVNASDDGREYVFRIGEVEPIPEHWPLVIGDVLFNLRSALDHLAYQLHAEHLGTPLPKAIERNVMFPVMGSPSDWKKKGHWRVKGLPTAQIAKIERLQPYHTADWDDPDVEYVGDCRFVGFLHGLQMVDKHRRLHVLSRAPVIIPSTLSTHDFGLTMIQNEEPLESNAVIARWRFVLAPPSMEVNTAARIRVVVSEAEGWDIDLLLFVCAEAVARILDDFRQFFASP